MPNTAIENHVDNWLKDIEEKNSPFPSLSEKKIDDLYALAYFLYQNRRYNEAEQFFRILVVLKPGKIKFWKGFGSSLQMQQDYAQALNCYLCAVQLTEPQSVDPYLLVQAADCYFGLKKSEEALKTLDSAYIIAKKNNQHPILQHVLFMRQLWAKK